MTLFHWRLGEHWYPDGRCNEEPKASDEATIFQGRQPQAYLLQVMR